MKARCVSSASSSGQSAQLGSNHVDEDSAAVNEQLADDGGFEPATGALADLLKKMAIVVPKAQAQLLLKEADYYATKAVAFDGA